MLMFHSSNVAAALAVLPGSDDAPRVLKQNTSIFLVSRFGDLWRVYDSDAPGGDEAHHTMPSRGSTLPHRLFIALSRTHQARVYTFSLAEARDVDPVTLQTQLDESAAE